MQAEANSSMSVSPYKLVDIGANLTNKSFNNRELGEVIDRAKESGVCKIIVTGTSLDCSKEAYRLTHLYPEYLYFTAGVHPHDAKHFNESQLKEITELSRNKECVAIGECGLDFNRNFSPPDVQLEVFEAQVKLACELQKPLFVHEREAHDDLIRILNKYSERLPPTVIHCFTGTMTEAQAYVNKGFYIGLTGFLWKDKLENGVQYGLKNGLLPLERLLIETDAPFMYPNIKAKKIPKNIQDRISEHAKRYLFKYCSFQRHEPCGLPAVAELIAAFMNVPADEVAFNTTVNAVKVFGLS